MHNYMSSATSHVSTQVRETVEALGELTSFCTWVGHACTIIFWYQKEVGQVYLVLKRQLFLMTAGGSSKLAQIRGLS